MNFTKFDKSGPNLQQVQFEKFELKTSGSSWILVKGSKGQGRELVWGQKSIQKVEFLCKSPMARIEDRNLFEYVLNGKNLYGEVQLAGVDAKHDPKMREGLGEWICTKAMARKKC